jgi:hypothetical protein
VATFYVTNGKVVLPWLLHQTPFLTIYVSVSFQTQNYQIKTHEARKINPTFALESNICNTDRQVLTSSTKSRFFFFFRFTAACISSVIHGTKFRSGMEITTNVFVFYKEMMGGTAA